MFSNRTREIPCSSPSFSPIGIFNGLRPATPLFVDDERRLQVTPVTPSSAPEHLSGASAAWFDSVMAEFLMAEHDVRLLQLAAEQWDLGQKARELVAKDGPVVDDRYGVPKVNPAMVVARDASLTFARLVKQLGLTSSPEDL